MRIIDTIKQKIKHFGPNGWLDEIFFTALILFVAVGAFSLGVTHERKQHQTDNPVEITYNNEYEQIWNAFYQEDTGGGSYVASKNSTIYYAAGCSGVNRIKPENRIYFDSANEAEGLGYRASSSC